MAVITEQRWQEILKTALTRTMLEDARLLTFRRLAETAPIGDWAEVGVRDGGVCLLLRELLPVVKGFACDTFEGMPNLAQADEPYLVPGLYTSMPDTIKVLQDADINVVQGVFPQSATEQMRNTKYALVHLDADLYTSTRDAIEFFWSRMEIGGFLVFDDYGRAECPGVARAVEPIAGPRSFHSLDVGLNQLVLRKA